MKKSNLFARFQSILLIFLMLLASGCGSRNQKNGESQEQTNVEEGAVEELTVEEANELVGGDNSAFPTIEEMFEPFQEVNNQLLDPDAPHNIGGEPLNEFARKFSSDVSFQKVRTHLREGSPYNFEYKVGLLDISFPDSTNYFASWSLIENDQASFCEGWLGSEMNKEYIFCRNSDGKWYLTEYFSALNEM